jgi:hypothetical protein
VASSPIVLDVVRTRVVVMAFTDTDCLHYMYTFPTRRLDSLVELSVHGFDIYLQRFVRVSSSPAHRERRRVVLQAPGHYVHLFTCTCKLTSFRSISLTVQYMYMYLGTNTCMYSMSARGTETTKTQALGLVGLSLIRVLRSSRATRTIFVAFYQ